MQWKRLKKNLAANAVSAIAVATAASKAPNTKKAGIPSLFSFTVVKADLRCRQRRLGGLHGCGKYTLSISRVHHVVNDGLKIVRRRL